MKNNNKIRPLENVSFGAYADYDLKAPLSKEAILEIAEAFHEHLVLIFKNADLSLDQLHHLTLSLGQPDEGKGHWAKRVDDKAHTGIRVIENVEEGVYGPRSNTELFWHVDRFFDPLVAGILNSVIIPETGGNTSFCNMYQAYDELPDALKERVQHLSIKQDCVVNEAGEKAIRRTTDTVEDVTTSPGVEIPIVLTHPSTHKPYLYLGNRINSYIPGLSLADSEALLDTLWEHADNPRFHYTHKWQENDLVLYEQRCVMHKRDAFPAHMKRKLHASVIVQSEIF